ncbi:MAG: hypothetical protein ABID63_18200 [Pseudomonadota bacterium]
MKRIFGIAIAAILFLWVITPALADPARCMPVDSMITGLAQQHGETPVARGVLFNGNLLLVFATPDGATWTHVVVTPGGVACSVASGDA